MATDREQGVKEMTMQFSRAVLQTAVLTCKRHRLLLIQHILNFYFPYDVRNKPFLIKPNGYISQKKLVKNVVPHVFFCYRQSLFVHISLRRTKQGTKIYAFK
jgi:hypothetical protein